MLIGISAGINEVKSLVSGARSRVGSRPVGANLAAWRHSRTVRSDGNAVALCLLNVYIFSGLPSSVIFHEETRLVTPNCFFMLIFLGKFRDFKKKVSRPRNTLNRHLQMQANDYKIKQL